MKYRSSAQSDLPVQPGQPKEEAFDELPFKFANIVPNWLMLPDEQVQAMVFQPTIWQRRWGLFKRRRGPATTVVLSPEHLILAQEDAPAAGAAYGMIARYCPRSRLASLTLERAEEDLWLAVVARLHGVEEKLAHAVRTVGRAGAAYPVGPGWAVRSGGDVLEVSTHCLFLGQPERPELDGQPGR